MIESIATGYDSNLYRYEVGGIMWTVWARFCSDNVAMHRPLEKDIFGRTLDYCIGVLDDGIKRRLLGSIDNHRLRNLNTGEVIPAALFA